MRDSGVFAFDAPFRGSLAGTRGLSAIVGISPAPSGGYRLVTADGATHAFGPTSLGALTTRLAAPIVGVAG